MSYGYYKCDRKECDNPLHFPVYVFDVITSENGNQRPSHYHWECFKRWAQAVIAEEGFRDE